MSPNIHLNTASYKTGNRKCDSNPLHSTCVLWDLNIKESQMNTWTNVLTGISYFRRRRAALRRGDARWVSEWLSPAPPAQGGKTHNEELFLIYRKHIQSQWWKETWNQHKLVSALNHKIFVKVMRSSQFIQYSRRKKVFIKYNNRDHQTFFFCPPTEQESYEHLPPSVDLPVTLWRRTAGSLSLSNHQHCDTRLLLVSDTIQNESMPPK